MARTVSWGTIGCGDVVERKGGPPLWEVEGSRLAAVMRRTRAKAEDFARRHGVPRFYDTVEGLLADAEVEAVYVATPNNTHLEPALAAIAAGKHVLVEKPMGRSAEACDRMIRAAADAGVILAVAYYRRCYPTVLRAKELIDEGAVGPVRTIRINDEFPLSHRLDLVHFFAGDAAEVWSATEPLAPGSYAEGTGPVLHVRTASGAEGIMNIGWDEKLAPETIDIAGESGAIRITDLKRGTMEIERDGRTVPEDVGPLPWTHTGLVRNFVEYVNGRAPLACDGVEGRKSTVILDIVDTLEPDGPKVAVDYANPPKKEVEPGPGADP